MWILQAACNNVAGPFPGFPSGLAPEAGARRVAALAKARALAAALRLAITSLQGQRGYDKVHNTLSCSVRDIAGN